MTKLRLHVLYAGRGDAMVIEDGNKLTIVDGGPEILSFSGYTRTPYYLYLHCREQMNCPGL